MKHVLAILALVLWPLSAIAHPPSGTPPVHNTGTCGICGSNYWSAVGLKAVTYAQYNWTCDEFTAEAMLVSQVTTCHDDHYNDGDCGCQYEEDHTMYLYYLGQASSRMSDAQSEFVAANGYRVYADAAVTIGIAKCTNSQCVTALANFILAEANYEWAMDDYSDACAYIDEAVEYLEQAGALLEQYECQCPQW